MDGLRLVSRWKELIGQREGGLIGQRAGGLLGQREVWGLSRTIWQLPGKLSGNYVGTIGNHLGTMREKSGTIWKLRGRRIDEWTSRVPWLGVRSKMKNLIAILK
jgi:hypothetical protein